MAKVTLVDHAAKDYPEHGIKKGEPYYWWKHRHGSKQFSKKPPKPSQTANSPFYAALYATQELFEGIKADAYEHVADFEGDIEQGKDDLENLKSETEDKLGNMPDSLQQGPTGELLQGRVDGLDELIGEFDSLDCEEPDEDMIKEELASNLKVTPEQLEANRLQKVHEKVQELLDEIAGFNWGIE